MPTEPDFSKVLDSELSVHYSRDNEGIEWWLTPSILPGVIAEASNTLVNPVTISFGPAKAAIAYQGLAGGFVGLYEFYVTVPSGLANGDYQLNVTQNETSVPQTIYLTVHN